jgi:RNA-directed DNA polymerase
MERREPQKLDRKKPTQPGHRTGTTGSTSKVDFKLELQTNSWLRIGLSAKDLKKKFCNLFCHFSMANLREGFHALDGSKAVGVDGMTKHDYGKNLDVNLTDLLKRLHTGSYRPLPKKGTLIPKANGKTRPIAISAFEDKLVEWVLSKILSSVYEPMFIRNSFGFRPRRSAHDALVASYCCLKDNKRPFVVEIDLASFFDTVRQRKRMKLIKRRITDRRILGLIARFLNAGVLNQEGNLQVSDLGTPQGSIMSPVLANVFLHWVIDAWFIENYASSSAVVIRYADDAIFAFRTEDEAEAFRKALSARLEAFGLKLNEEKSGLIRFGKHQENVFHFLGFTFYWKRDWRTPKRVLMVKTERAKLGKKIQEFNEWIRQTRNRLKLDEIWEQAAAKLRGHYNYYGVHTNRPKLNHFYFAATKSLFKWLNRRSQRKSFNWERFTARLRHNPLPIPPRVASLRSLTNRRVHAF